MQYIFYRCIHAISTYSIDRCVAAHILHYYIPFFHQTVKEIAEQLRGIEEDMGESSMIFDIYIKPKQAMTIMSAWKGNCDCSDLAHIVYCVLNATREDQSR